MTSALDRLQSAVKSVNADHIKFAAAVSSPFLGYWLWTKWAAYVKDHPDVPSIVEQAPQVSQLWVYPVKSCQGYSVKQGKLYPGGFEYDREWAIANAAIGNREDPRSAAPQILSLRDIPKLRFIQATIDESKRVLRLTKSVDGHPGSKVVESFEVPLDRAEGERAVEDAALWDIKAQVYHEGDEVAKKLTEWLDYPVYLVRIKGHRVPSTCGMDGEVAEKKDRANMQDFSPLHLVTEESVRFVQNGLPNHNITLSRFRANIVLKGMVHPDENLLLRFKLGDIHLRTGKLTGRCTVPTVNEEAQKDPHFNPTAFLKKNRAVSQKHRKEEENRKPEPILGLNVFPILKENLPVSPKKDEVKDASPESEEEVWPKIINVGDPLVITKTRKIIYDGALKF